VTTDGFKKASAVHRRLDADFCNKIGQFQTRALQQIASLFNHLVSERYAISLGEQCGVGPPRRLSTGSGGAPQLANTPQLRQFFGSTGSYLGNAG
jgi:hypothetical protein